MSSDASSVFTGNWQSDDEPPQDKVGDLCPLSVQAARVVLVKQIIQLGDSLVNVTPYDAVTLQLRILDADAKPPYDLSDHPEKRWKVEDLDEVYPEVVQTLAFTRVGETCLIMKRDNAGVKPTTKRDGKRLEVYRREFVKLQSDPSTTSKAQIQRRLAEHLKPFAVLRFVHKETREPIAGSDAMRITIRPTSTWQMAQEQSHIHLRVWDCPDPTEQWTYTDLQQKTPETVLAQIASTPSKMLQNLYRSLRVGETCRIEWNGHDQSLSKSDVCYIEMTGYSSTQKYYCYPPHSEDAPLSRTKRDNGIEPVVVEFTTKHTVANEPNWMLSRATGNMQPETGTFVVLQIDERNVGFVLNRTVSIPMWFHQLVCEMRPNYQYLLKPENDIVFESAATALCTPVSDELYDQLLRRYASSPKSDAHHGEDEMAFHEKKDWEAVMLNLTHKSFATKTGKATVTFTPDLSAPYDIIIPDTLDTYNKVGNLDHAAQSDSFVLRANHVYHLCLLGDLSKELSPWDDNIDLCLQNAVRGLRNCQLSLFGTWAMSAYEFIRHFTARKLEDPEIDELSAICARENLSLCEISPETIPTIKSLCPALYRSLNNVAVYLTAQGEARNPLSLIATLDKIVGPPNWSILKLRCKALLELQEYSAVVSLLTAANNDDPEACALLKKARTAQSQYQTESKAMFQRMFR